MAGLLARHDLLLIYSVNAALFLALGLGLALWPGPLREPAPAPDEKGLTKEARPD